MQLAETTTIEQFRRLLNSNSYDFRFECGISKPVVSIEEVDKEKIITAMALHFSISVCKTELDQLINGLETLQVKIIHTLASYASVRMRKRGVQ